MAVLTVNDDVVIPGTVVCVHVETILTPDKINPKRQIHSLRCWGAVAGRIEDNRWTREKAKHSNLAQDFWDWLNYVRQPQRPAWVFSRSLPITLTVLGLWSRMESGEFSLHRRPPANLVDYRRRRGDKRPDRVVKGLLITTGPPDAVVMYHRTGWKIICLDCANFSLTPATAHSDTESTDVSSSPLATAPVANWYDYSIKQARRVVSAVTDLIVWHRQQELGRFGFSIAGIALAGFRHRFMDTTIHLPDEQEERDLQRSGYYPGRVEAFWVGKIEENSYTPVAHLPRARQLAFDTPRPPFYHLDARSFYGAVGSACTLPVECIESSPDATDCPLPRSGRMVEYLAGVELATSDHVYPVRHSGRCLYARGHFRTVLCGPELTRAHQRGHVVRWLWWRRFRLEPIFKAYSDAMYAERERNEKGGNLTVCRAAKDLLARLHGKFLQRATKWEARPEMIAPEPWAQWSDYSVSTGRERKFRSIAWDVEEEVPNDDAPHCFPAIAAWVTSYGRTWLEDWIGFAGKENVLYVATDSLIVSEIGRKRLKDRGIIFGCGIGSLKDAAPVASLEIRSQNNLRIGTRRIKAGQSERPASGDYLLCRTVQEDSLVTILFGRQRHDCGQSEQPFTDRPPLILQDISPEGWLLPPVVNTCQTVTQRLASVC